MSYFIKIRRNQMIVFYVILVHLTMIIQSDKQRLSRNIQCYTCTGREECGISFSSSSDKNMQNIANGDELLYSCSITVSFEGITKRNLMLSNTCRSSAYEFCCKDNLCNSLPSPPLPAFTTLMCIVGRCSQKHHNLCEDGYHVGFRSSAAESCSLTMEPYGDYVYKSYRKTCFPGLIDITIGPTEEWFTKQSFCCNTLECRLQSADNDIAIGCYVCDSRVTGLEGCSILTTGSPYVYGSGSSSPSEACATIAGLAGHDVLSNRSYPAFTIRTFIANCVNQSLGNVSYGGATFQGRINCCWANYCNTEPLDVYLHPVATTTIITTATDIASTRKNTDKKTTTKAGSGPHVLKLIAIIFSVVAMCGIAIVILWVIRRSNVRKREHRSREDLFSESAEEIPICSPLESGTLPFLQDHHLIT